MTQAVPTSVVVCNMNGMKFLPRLIASLQSQRGIETDIVVFDRESKDGSREYLAGIPNIRVITLPGASGLVAGYQSVSQI